MSSLHEYLPGKATYPYGYISGLELNNFDLGDRRHDMRLETGSCLNSSGTRLITVSSTLTKQYDVAWAEGDAQGGGSPVIPSSAGTGFYYFYLISKDSDSGATIDVYGDTSSSGANVPSGWTVERKLGSERYNNVAGGSLGLADAVGRRQNGNFVTQAVNSRHFNVVNDSSFVSGTDESFDLGQYFPDGEMADWHLNVSSVTTNTSFQYFFVVGQYNNAQASTTSHTMITGVVASGDVETNTSQIIIPARQQTTHTYYYVVTSGNPISGLTIRIMLDGYEDLRELNYVD